MFLNKLNIENKNNFLKLCVYTAMSNGEFAEEQKSVIYEYCKEMELEACIPDTAESLECILSELASSTTEEEKKIILLEILALINCDGLYDEDEKVFVELLVNKLTIDKEVEENIIRLLENYTSICKELFTVIYS